MKKLAPLAIALLTFSSAAPALAISQGFVNEMCAVWRSTNRRGMSAKSKIKFAAVTRAYRRGESASDANRNIFAAMRNQCPSVY